MNIQTDNYKFLLRCFRYPSPTRSNQGWTLIEMGVIVVIIGILAAMSFPSFNKMQARNQLRGAMSEVQGSIQEAPKNAIKKGASCIVNLKITIAIFT